jgi:hypothetical protein
MKQLLVLVAAAVLPVPEDDAEIARLLRDKGVKVTETRGMVSSVEVGDCSKWTEEDFRQLARLAHLKSLSVGPGLSDAQLPLLSGLSELETLQTNLSLITDDGVKSLAALKSLKVLKFFHPSKAFSGTGLLALTELPALERLTVAGSLAFGDDGMAAVGKLTRLKEFRSWHAGQTLEGVKKLKDLPNLKQLTLGQRLAYAPPTTLSDETLAALAGMKSLESLQLEEARLGRAALRQLKQLPDLKKLVLEGIDLPESEVDALRQDLPAVEIKWTKPSDIYLKRINALFGAR